jgi:hypothetical protein
VTVGGVITLLPSGVTITSPPAAGVLYWAPHNGLLLPTALQDDGLALLALGGQRPAVVLVGVRSQVVQRPVTS